MRRRGVQREQARIRAFELDQPARHDLAVTTNDRAGVRQWVGLCPIDRRQTGVSREIEKAGGRLHPLRHIDNFDRIAPRRKL